MRIAITGGSGFIGSHVVDRLQQAGHQVVVVDTRPPHRAGVAYRDVDITDLPGLVRASSGCDAIFHLAAVSNVNDAHADPVGTMELNVVGTARACEAARRNKIGRVLLASTVWVYASAAGEGTLTEASPLLPSGTGHVYTASKVAAEMVVTSFGELYGVPYTVLRYGIPYGPRMRDELVIPRFLKSARDGTRISIQGDGLQFRNYLYVEDLADAHVRALAPEGANQVFNLEGPAPVSIREVAETAQRLVNPAVRIEYVPSRPGDYAGREISGAKAAEVLGWAPRTSFAAGMERYLAWWLEAEADQVEASGG